MSNLQKAFKNKARFGLRMAAGGLLEQTSRPMPTTVLGGGVGMMSQVRDATNARPPGLAGSPSNLGMSQGLSGAWSMDAGSANPAATPAVAKPEGLRAAQPAAPTVAPTPANPLYKPGTATDPHASALPIAAPRPVVAAAPAQNDPTPNMMTPVDELLPSRSGLRLADGGVVAPETAEQLMARMAKKYGGGASAAVKPQPAPAPAPVVVAPAPAAKPAGGGLVGDAVRGLRGRKAQIDEAAGFAEGGIVRGKGGVDNVPMNINGVDVNLTGGKAPEAVLPSKTVQALGGPEAVEELIERTNGKPPVRSGLRAGGAYGDGLVNIPQVKTPDPRFVKEQGATDDAIAREKLDSAIMAATYGGRVKPGALATTNDAPVVVEQAPVSTEVTPSASTSLRDAERTLADTAPEGWATQDLAQETADSELAARVLGPNAAVPQGLRASTDASGGRRLDFTSTNNAANDSMNQGLRKNNGEGVASMRQKDGTFKNIVLGASPTKWTDGPEYKAAMEQNAKDKLTLRDMQHDRIKRTAAMPGATVGDQVAYAGQIKDDETEAVNNKNLNEASFRNQDLGLRRDEMGLRREQNAVAQQNIIDDNRRADAAARTQRDKNTRAEVGEHLKTAATDEGGEVNGQKLAWLERAVSQINDPNMDPDLLAQKKITHAKTLSWLNDVGVLPHWLKNEKEQDGFTIPDYVQEGDNWVDKTTGQSVSAWRLSRAPIDVQQGFYDMVKMQADAKNKATK